MIRAKMVAKANALTYELITGIYVLVATRYIVPNLKLL